MGRRMKKIGKWFAVGLFVTGLTGCSVPDLSGILESQKQPQTVIQESEADTPMDSENQAAAKPTEEQPTETTIKPDVKDSYTTEQNDFSNVQPVSVSDFGEVFDAFRGKPKEAIAFLLTKAYPISTPCKLSVIRFLS